MYTIWINSFLYIFQGEDEIKFYCAELLFDAGSTPSKESKLANEV